MELLKYLATFIILQLTEVADGQRPFKPSRPVVKNPRICFRPYEKHGRRVMFISDQETKCAYWACTRSGRLLPRQCGLQTYISEFYEADDYNPCTEKYNHSQQFDCTRKGYDPDGTPTCLKTYLDLRVCKNGGEPTAQGNLCWCKCKSGFKGFTCEMVDDGTDNDDAASNAPPSDISRSDFNTLAELFIKLSRSQLPAPAVSNADKEVTGNREKEFAEADSKEAPVVIPPPKATVDVDGKFNFGDPCPDGPPRDYCAESPGHCKNGGRCYNQCLGPICDCKPPFVAGARCEKFACVGGRECMNGGICRRGPTGTDSVFTCDCMAGFTGPMCEVIVNN